MKHKFVFLGDARERKCATCSQLESEATSLCMSHVDALKMLQQMSNEAVLRHKKRILENRKAVVCMLGEDSPWSLGECVAKLIEASNILLNDKDYDGHGHEFIATARDKAAEYLREYEETTQKLIHSLPENK